MQRTMTDTFWIFYEVNFDIYFEKIKSTRPRACVRAFLSAFIRLRCVCRSHRILISIWCASWLSRSGSMFSAETQQKKKPKKRNERQSLSAPKPISSFEANHFLRAGERHVYATKSIDTFLYEWTENVCKNMMFIRYWNCNEQLFLSPTEDPLAYRLRAFSCEMFCVDSESQNSFEEKFNWIICCSIKWPMDLSNKIRKCKENIVWLRFN